jgi:hypothetical protein
METLDEPRTLTNRLVDIAPLSDKISAIAEADDGTWVLEFSDKTIVLMEWMNNPERIVLNAPLGIPPRDRAEEIFSLALSFSALSRESCGARLGMGGKEGEMVLIRELHCNTAGGWDLLPVLEHFAYVASWWQDVINQPPRSHAANEEMSGMLVRA